MSEGILKMLNSVNETVKADEDEFEDALEDYPNESKVENPTLGLKKMPTLQEQMTAIIDDSYSPMEPEPLMEPEPGKEKGKPVKEKSDCSICREEGDGYHFGAEACRACAAFFRRSVSLNKQYQCRGNGNCEITANIRCMCRACRFTRCIEVGMNPAGVQQRRDTIGKRDNVRDVDLELASLLNSPGEATTSQPRSPCPPLSELPQMLADKMPILLKMRSNYGKMDNARLVIHRKEGQSLFKGNIPKAINYKEAAEQGVREVSLVADWVAWCFDDFVTLPIDQKKILFRNFYTPFCMLEGSFLCHINNTSNAIILPSGDYIDIQNLDTFFFDPEADRPDMSAEEIDKSCRMFKPSFDLHRRSMILPMMAEKVDVYEFFALATMIFWDFGLDGQSEECVSIGKVVKDRVMKELTVYLKFVRRLEEPAIRVSTLMTLIPALLRSVRRFQEDIEITHVFKIYAPQEDFYNLVNGKFC